MRNCVKENGGKVMKTLVKIILATVTFALTCSVAGAHNGGGGGGGGHFGGRGHFGGGGGFGHFPGGPPGHFYGGPWGFFGYDYYPWGWYGYGPYYGPSDYPAVNHERAGTLAREVQEQLASEGFYTGRIDGIVGPSTRAGIRRYQERHGLMVTGLIDRKLIRSLGIE